MARKKKEVKQPSDPSKAVTAKGNEFDKFSIENPIFPNSAFSKNILDNENAIIDEAVKQKIITPTMGKYFKITLLPRDHKNYLSPRAAAEKFFPDEKYERVLGWDRRDCREILKHILYGKLHIEYKRGKVADGVATGKRGTSKRRSKEQIAFDRKIKEFEAEARNELDIPHATPLIALSKEQRESIEEYVQNKMKEEETMAVAT